MALHRPRHRWRYLLRYLLQYSPRLLAALLILVTASMPNAQAEERSGSHRYSRNLRHGAIAYDRDSGRVGYAYDHRSTREARAQALMQCGEQCEVVIDLRNNCGALAAKAPKKSAPKKSASTQEPPMAPVTAHGATREEAQTKVKRLCGSDCQIPAWACSR
jgi:Domain of unknown function (DUF4189)